MVYNNYDNDGEGTAMDQIQFPINMAKRKRFLEGILIHDVSCKRLEARRSDLKYSNIPTLFIHGSMGGALSFNNMLKRLNAKFAGEKVLLVIVTFTGKLRFIGDWDARLDNNPLIQVIFERNIGVSYKREAEWINQILHVLKFKFGVEKYNAVAHSWGSGSLVYMGFANGQDKDVPEINKFVLLAAPINNALHKWNHLNPDGSSQKGDSSFKFMEINRKYFPETAQILNVYSNRKNRKTDGSVPNVSSQSLAYLVRDTVKEYREALVEDLSHFEMHENERIDDMIIDFLWRNK
ncbi:hypothetical protein AYR58_04100 [Pediococcus claussenii]|nr:hypothetical protein AYR58_04100 [Pediococcus claussenii]